MRAIFVILLILGFVTITLSVLGRAGEITRWSNLYALFEQTGDKNPLHSQEIRDRFDAISLRGNPFLTALAFTGFLTCAIAITGLVKTTKKQITN